MPRKPKATPSVDWSRTPVELRHRKPFNVSIPEKTIAKLSKLATIYGCSRAQLIELLIETEAKRKQV